MKTTRQHINEAAGSLASILGIFTGKTDDEIDHLMDNYEAEALAETITELLDNARDVEL
jgi:hypothetical protein